MVCKQRLALEKRSARSADAIKVQVLSRDISQLQAKPETASNT